MGKRKDGFWEMLIGYCRVSTDDQSMDLQRDAMIRAEVSSDYIYEETVSGAKTKRPVFEECLRSLRPGDTLVIWRFDRLGRSLRELIEVARELQERRIGLKSITEGIDTTTPSGMFVFHILGAIAEFERNIISERTKAGLRAAKARGHRGGRKPAVDEKKLEEIESMLLNPLITMERACNAYGVSPAAVYRARKRRELRLQLEQMERDKAEGKWPHGIVKY
ncbi:MAG: recombinase family protein [Pikeienuella sp.]